MSAEGLSQDKYFDEMDWKFSEVIIIIIIIIIHSLELFASALADSFSLEFEWQQVFWSLQDSS